MANTAHISSFLSSAHLALVPMRQHTVSYTPLGTTADHILTISAGWEDISLVLNEADATFGHTGAWEFGATGGVMSTADQGKTWNFTTLSVPETAIEYAQARK